MKALLQQALDALNTYQVLSCVGGGAYDPECADDKVSEAVEHLRAAIAQPEIEPTIKESLKVHASAEDYLRHTYGAYRGHFAWRELEEAYSQGRCDESMAQGPIPWPVHRPGTVGIDE